MMYIVKTISGMVVALFFYKTDLDFYIEGVNASFKEKRFWDFYTVTEKPKDWDLVNSLQEQE